MYPKKMTKGEHVKFASSEHIEEVLRKEGWEVEGETKSAPRGRPAAKKIEEK